MENLFLCLLKQQAVKTNWKRGRLVSCTPREGNEPHVHMNKSNGGLRVGMDALKKINV
jgi:hypothetical protein